jgi:hypothetical protein
LADGKLLEEHEADVLREGISALIAAFRKTDVSMPLVAPIDKGDNPIPSSNRLVSTLLA